MKLWPLLFCILFSDISDVKALVLEVQSFIELRESQHIEQESSIDKIGNHLNSLYFELSPYNLLVEIVGKGRKAESSLLLSH